MAVRSAGLAASVRGASIAVVLALWWGVLIAAGSAALAFQAGVPGPPFDDTTVRVDVSWQNDLVMLAYDLAPASDKPYASGSPGVWPVTCGATGPTLYLSEAPLFDRPHGNWVHYQTFGPGSYRLVVEFGGHCFDLDTPVDAPDPAFEAFPEGSPVPFTATVRYYAADADKPFDTVTLTGEVTVEFDPASLAGLTDVGPVELRAEVPAGFTGDIGQLPEVGTPLIPPAVAGAPPAPTDETATGVDGPPASSSRGGSGRTLLLVAVVVVLVLLLVALRLLQVNRREDRFGRRLPPMIKSDETAAIATALITDPRGLVANVTEQAEVWQKADAGPQFHSTGAPAGEVKVRQHVEARTPDGKTVSLQAGTSYPAGATVTWHGAKWTSVQVGTDWYWVRSDQPGVKASYEEALERPPDVPDKPAQGKSD